MSSPFIGYKTSLGQFSCAKIEDWLESRAAQALSGTVQLIFTSPPFPLNRKKSYGNLTGEKYVKWLEELAPRLVELLAEDGSIVIEIGNAWNEGEPTMSTLPLEALLAFKKAGGLKLCQEFICHNPARLPSPTEYVNVKRIRLKDSWTRLWWMSKSTEPKANNKNILLPYSKSMQALLKRQSYNAGKRPSEHVIGKTSFLTDHGGAIASSAMDEAALEHFGSFIVAGNTKSGGDAYLEWCRKAGVEPHPARMPEGLPSAFISFLTDEGDLVLDPFAGSNTTGWVAERLGRRWVATEAEQKNVEASKARFMPAEDGE